MTTVSIILPTYNRARFLPQAFESIRAQTWTNWELIIVDDGSTDNSQELVATLSAGITQPVRYVRQENQGAYGARNTGVGLARGDYVAFFDSDDYWLPHHLKDCVEALQANPDVDWAYGACKRVEFATGKLLTPHSFYVDERPRPFLSLRTRAAGPLQIIDDPAATECMILHGLFNGLQNSVMLRRVFEKLRFHTTFRNEAEDCVFVVRALKAGFRVGYLNNIHFIYYVHGANSSASSNESVEKHLRVIEGLVQGWEELRKQVQLTPTETRALNVRLSQEYFWSLGYSLLWSNGRQREALQMYRRGLKLCPWNLRYWKTYLLALVRTMVRPRRDSLQSSLEVANR